MKKNICRSLFYGWGLVGAPFLFPAEAQAEVADWILVSDNVITMASGDPRAAVPLGIAVKDGRILGVAEKDQLDAWTADGTTIVDVGDNTVLPGFIDAHGHVGFSALATTMANVASPPVGKVTNIATLQAQLRDFIATRNIPPGSWVIGMGYDDSLILEQRHPNRQDLDAASSDHPILLLHVSGHLMAANSRALARGGITAESADPAGGHIRRLPGSTEPNGVLEESAAAPLRRYMAASNVDPEESVIAAFEQYASFGITTAQDGASNLQSIELLREVGAKGKLPMDVVAYPIGSGDVDAISSAYTWGTYENRLKIGGIKLILDGSPQGKTAYLTKPYHVPPLGQDAAYRGYPTIAPVDATDLITAYLRKRIPILAHANGDAAADILINAVADAQPTHDHRTVMIHAQTVREDQLTRMKGLRLIPSYFSAHTYYWGDWHRDSVLGEDRAKRISPTASTLARGMVFTVHNDAPIVPPDMLRLLWSTTNRKTRSDVTLGPDQRISVYDALQAMTIHAAYQNFEEADKGSIKAGKLADLVVLSGNPLRDDILTLRVEATYSHGRRIYPGM